LPALILKKIGPTWYMPLNFDSLGLSLFRFFPAVAHIDDIMSIFVNCSSGVEGAAQARIASADPNTEDFANNSASAGAQPALSRRESIPSASSRCIVRECNRNLIKAYNKVRFSF
jgi:hypothetical protein